MLMPRHVLFFKSLSFLYPYMFEQAVMKAAELKRTFANDPDLLLTFHFLKHLIVKLTVMGLQLSFEVLSLIERLVN